MERMLYPKQGKIPENDWKVIKTDNGVCKGNIPWIPDCGQRLSLEGVWKNSDYNGEREFNFYFASLDIPDNPRSLLSYVASITKGIGDAKESEIWKIYGEKWADDPMLCMMTGLSETIIDNWGKSLIKIDLERHKTSAISFLLANGCSARLSELGWQKWNIGTIGIVTKNCYELTKLDNCGFKTVDKNIRSYFGIGDEDKRRYIAAIYYVLDGSGRGDTVYSGDTLENELKVFGLLNFEQILADLIIDKSVILLVDEDMEYFSSQNDHKHETVILKWFSDEL